MRLPGVVRDPADPGRQRIAPPILDAPVGGLLEITEVGRRPRDSPWDDILRWRLPDREAMVIRPELKDALTMFGFLRAGPSDVQYRRLYAGCCSFQHRRFGVGTLPLLSYEGVFLYVLAADAGACGLPDDSAVTCCRLRKRGARLHPVDETLATFCSCFGLLLASVKLEDDVRDDRSLLARLALWRLKARIENAKAYFEKFDPHFLQRIERTIAAHLNLEQAPSRPALDEFAEPTADAFGYLFSLFAKLLPAGQVSEALLHEIGAAVGRAIICFDCAADWERDRRRQRFNPLADRRAVEGALLASQRWLSDVGWRCTEAFGQDSRAAAVAGATFRRIQSRCCRANLEPEDPSMGWLAAELATPRPVFVGTSQASPPAIPPNTASSAARWRPRRFLRRGDCDCCCDPSCCEGCNCDCPTGDDSADACVCCCVHGDCCCDWSRDNSKKRKGDVKQSPAPQHRGLFGRTLGPLQPSGVVLLGGERLPARAESGWIEADVEVVVVKDEPFGVLVRPTATNSEAADTQ